MVAERRELQPICNQMRRNTLVSHKAEKVNRLVSSERLLVPPAGFEPAHPAPEAGALSPELRGRQSVMVRRHAVNAPTR